MLKIAHNLEVSVYYTAQARFPKAGAALRVGALCARAGSGWHDVCSGGAPEWFGTHLASRARARGSYYAPVRRCVGTRCTGPGNYFRPF